MELEHHSAAGQGLGQQALDQFVEALVRSPAPLCQPDGFIRRGCLAPRLATRARRSASKPGDTARLAGLSGAYPRERPPDLGQLRCLTSRLSPHREALSVRAVSRRADRVRVVFDDPGLVADCGLMIVATLAARLGLEAVIDATVRFTDRKGGFRPGRKVLTIVHAMIGGGSHIAHTDRLRAGATGRVVEHRVMAPSTLGTFLRACSFGHVRQLEAVIGESVRRAWRVGIGPGSVRLVIDIDSTICQVYGRAKSGAAYGYTKVLGYHPIVAVRADTGEIVHARMRKGSANTAGERNVSWRRSSLESAGPPRPAR